MRQILYGAFLIGAIFAVGIVFIMTIEGQILTTGGSAKNIVTGISEDDQISDGFEQHETQKNSELENTDDGYVLHIVILILSVTTFVSILISFYLYRWRKVLLAKPNLLVPEEWGKYLAHVGGNLEKLVPVVNKNFTALSSSLNDNSEKIRNMIDTFMILQNSLDEKDREINRLKQGYDAQIFKKFLIRFIRIGQYVNDVANEESYGKEEIVIIRRLFNDAFEECGVESFSPNPGEDYRKVQGVTDNPKLIHTDNEEEEFKIAEIINPGYRLISPDGYEIISPAKVKVYSTSK